MYVKNDSLVARILKMIPLLPYIKNDSFIALY